jgi:hypothetical protein
MARPLGTVPDGRWLWLPGVGNLPAMNVVEGRRERWVDRSWLAERARLFTNVHVDFGGGDGAFAYWTAMHRPNDLVIGVDANGASLPEVSMISRYKPVASPRPVAKSTVEQKPNRGETSWKNCFNLSSSL